MAEVSSKPCVSCGRAITWRRKWARDWEQVRYCSSACRRRKITDTDTALETALRTCLRRRGATVDPLVIARQLGGNDWQELAEPARRAARRLVTTGRYDIVIDGHVCDPSTAKGNFRLRRC